MHLNPLHARAFTYLSFTPLTGLPSALCTLVMHTPQCILCYPARTPGRTLEIIRDNIPFLLLLLAQFRLQALVVTLNPHRPNDPHVKRLL